MTSRLRVEDAATAELRASALWYEAQRPGLGEEFIDEANRTLEFIERHPRVGRPIPRSNSERGMRRVSMNRFPYAVIYRERGDVVQVVAFAHHRRKPGYWRSR